MIQTRTQTKILNFVIRERGLENAFDLAENYLLRNFLQEVDFKNQDVDLKSLTELLQNDNLHLRHEEQVWKAIESWVKIDEGARKEHVDQLVKCLRIGLVSQPFLRDDVY